jgi:hypothetical protein
VSKLSDNIVCVTKTSVCPASCYRAYTLPVLPFYSTIIFDMGSDGSPTIPGGDMLTLLEAILLISLISMLLYWYLSPGQSTAKKALEERVAALERQHKELRNVIGLLVFKSNAFETQLPLTPEQKQQIKSLEDQITVARYLDTIFPE